MSRNNTAYCKVCQDAGKPEAIYRSHFTRETRDPNSRVTCPTLLALECRYCFKKGHTVKYCTTLKEKDRKQQPIKPQSKPAPQKPAAQPKSSNPYVCLESDSEEEENKVSTKPIESFPQLCAPAKTQHQGNNYAAALACKPIPKPVVTGAITPNNSEAKLAPWVSAPESVSKVSVSKVSASTVSVPVPPPPFKRPMRNWADDTDSEDEEDIMPSAPIKQAQEFKFVVPVVDEDW